MPDVLDLKREVRKYGHCCMPEKSSARTKKQNRKEARDLDVKIGFLEGLVRRDPAYVDALQLLGDCYTSRGRFAQSLKIDQQLALLEPRNPLVFYNLACSYSLYGDQDLAVAALDQALLLGYRDFKWLAKDPDLRSLRKHPGYRAIEARIRKMNIEIA